MVTLDDGRELQDACIEDHLLRVGHLYSILTLTNNGLGTNSGLVTSRCSGCLYGGPEEIMEGTENCSEGG